jgi:hypothetical protein
VIERRFPSRCEVRFPESQFFRILDRYVSRDKIWPITMILRSLERLVYLTAPFLRRYSYVVIVRLSKDGMPAPVLT